MHQSGPGRPHAPTGGRLPRCGSSPSPTHRLPPLCPAARGHFQTGTGTRPPAQFPSAGLPQRVMVRWAHGALMHIDNVCLRPCQHLNPCWGGDACNGGKNPGRVALLEHDQGHTNRTLASTQVPDDPLRARIWQMPMECESKEQVHLVQRVAFKPTRNVSSLGGWR